MSDDCACGGGYFALGSSDGHRADCATHGRYPMPSKVWLSEMDTPAVARDGCQALDRVRALALREQRNGGLLDPADVLAALDEAGVSDGYGCPIGDHLPVDCPGDRCRLAAATAPPTPTALTTRRRQERQRPLIPPMAGDPATDDPESYCRMCGSAGTSCTNDRCEHEDPSQRRSALVTCPHDWIVRGTSGDEWRECWLCGQTR